MILLVVTTVIKYWQWVTLNLYMNDPADESDGNCSDMMSVPGLDQHVSFHIHKVGNTLDLVFTEVGADLVICNSRCGPYLYGYGSVEFNILFNKMRWITVR